MCIQAVYWKFHRPPGTKKQRNIKCIKWKPISIELINGTIIGFESRRFCEYIYIDLSNCSKEMLVTTFTFNQMELKTGWLCYFSSTSSVFKIKISFSWRRFSASISSTFDLVTPVERLLICVQRFGPFRFAL